MNKLKTLARVASSAVLDIWWNWRLRRLRRKTGVIGFHPYPPDTETGWRKARKDYHGIKATAKLMAKMSNLGAMRRG